MSQVENRHDIADEAFTWPDWGGVTLLDEILTAPSNTSSIFADVSSSLIFEALEHASATFALWDAESKLIYCNEGFLRRFNLSADIARPGVPFQKLMKQADCPAHFIPHEYNMSTGQRQFELGFDDGQWLQLNEKRTPEGGMVSIGTDITILKEGTQKLVDQEQKLTETVSDLRKSRHELERQTQKLVDLTEKYATEKRNAETANHAKSQFLANISHELRTPLNPVIGFSEIMRDEMFGPVGDKKYSEYARDIHESGKYLLAVINDILDMSKIEAGRMSLTTGQFDVAEIVEDCLHIVGSNAHEAGIKLKRTGPAEMRAQIDNRAFKQILLNLLSNAIKFTPFGGTVHAELKVDGDDFELRITDNGIGIPSHALTKLGKPFEQVENQFTKSHKGSGLGLAISRSLVEMHGGSLEISSAMGTGTTVSCSFPQSLAVPTETTKPSSKSVA